MTHVPASSHTVFNGGTITTPLVIHASDPTAIPLEVRASWNAQIADFLRVSNTDNDGDMLVVNPSGDLLVTNHVTGALRGQISESSGVFTDSGGFSGNPITSGALPTVAPVSGTAFQCTIRDVFLTVPVTYNPGVATTATCKVELSPDNVTFSTLLTVTQPVGTVFDGSVEPVQLAVPAAWYVKLTVTNATLGPGTYY